MMLASGHTFEEMAPAEKEQYQKDVSGPVNDMILLQPGGWVVPRRYLQFEKKLFEFKFKPDDVVIMTYPKCGTTWMQEIIWTMLHNPNLDNEDAELSSWVRAPFIESDMLYDVAQNSQEKMIQEITQAFERLCPGKDPKDGAQILISEALPGRRVIKTHFPFSMLAPHLLSTAKVVFVARNPKDVCMSWQHHHRLIKGHNFKGSQDAFVDYFVKDLLLYGSFGLMLKEAWSKKDHPNMHFVFYEDLKADVDGELKKINDFIGAGLTEKQLKNVKEFTSFSSMKARDTVKIDSSSFANSDIENKDGGFFRKGQSGEWRGKFTQEQEAKIDEYAKRHFEGTGLTFKF